jgi:hypothetical protein
VAEKPGTELRGNEQYNALTEQIRAIAEDLRRAEANLNSADFEVASRDLGRELEEPRRQ